MSAARVVALLGGAHVIGRGLTSPLKLADRIEAGLPALCMGILKAEMGLTDAELSRALGTSPKTIGRLRKEPEGALTPSVSDRLYRLARIFDLALDVLESEEAAREWLGEPKIGLANRAPLELLGTEAGTREVEALLIRIEYGVLS